MAILFDLDGTLLDTSRDFHIALNKVLSAHNKPLVDYQTVRDVISDGSKRIVATALLNENITEPEISQRIEKLLPDFLEEYAHTEFQNTFAFPGIDDLLEHLESENIPWGIVTNKYKVLTEPLLQNTGYLSRTSCLVCGDATSNPKPKPDHLLIACQILKVDPKQCIYIGDSINDILAGRAAGMRTIAASFGFVPKHVNVANWRADAIANTPAEILPWIQEWRKTAN